MVLTLAVISFSVLADNVFGGDTCQANHLIAEYQITQLNKHHHRQAKTLTLMRNGKRVAHYHNGSKTADVWFLSKQETLQLTRFFEDFNQGIEYQPNDIKQQNDWMEKKALISSVLLKEMSLVDNKGEGCVQKQEFHFENQHYAMTLTWLPKLTLVERYRVINKATNEVVKEMQLNEKVFDKAAVKQHFRHWDSLNTTDFADIGDNENNPFLAKMINQGFSAVIEKPSVHAH